MNLIQLGPTVGAAFLASLVECVEAATIVLAVGTVRGWRSGLAGAGLGLFALLAIAAFLGPAIVRIPEQPLQIAVGILSLLFGMRWLRKAILRAAGVLALHDEEAVFRNETANLRLAHVTARYGLDPVAVAIAFKAVLLEGLEVVFIVVAVSAGGPGLFAAASLGAASACLLVALAAFALHRPLARVPENTLKLAVGMVISAFGVFWVGEGIGLPWPGQDMSLLAIAAGLLMTALLAIRILGRAVPGTLARGAR